MWHELNLPALKWLEIDGERLEATSKRGICIAPLLLQRLSDIEYKAYKAKSTFEASFGGATWSQAGALGRYHGDRGPVGAAQGGGAPDVGPPKPVEVTAKDGVKLEIAFLGALFCMGARDPAGMASEAAAEAYRRWGKHPGSSYHSYSTCETSINEPAGRSYKA